MSATPHRGQSSKPDREGPCPTKTRALPNLAANGCGPGHGFALFAVECLCKFRHVGGWGDGAKAAKGMRVGVQDQALVFGPVIRAPQLRVRDKKTLVRSQAADGRGHLPI